MYKIYKIYNDLNDKLYIGMTGQTLKQRLNNHFSKTARKPHEMTPFQKEIKKIGKKNFHIELIAETKNQDEAWDLERYYIEKYNTIQNGYNVLKGGRGVQLLSDDYYDVLISTFHKTKSIRKTAEIIGKAEGTISRQLSWVGVDKGMYSHLSEKEIENIILLNTNGISIGKIAKELNKDVETIKRALYPKSSKHKKYAHNRKCKLIKTDGYEIPFGSIKECCEFLLGANIAQNLSTCKSHVVRCLNGERETYKGLKFVEGEKQ